MIVRWRRDGEFHVWEFRRDLCDNCWISRVGTTVGKDHLARLLKLAEPDQLDYLTVICGMTVFGADDLSITCRNTMIRSYIAMRVGRLPNFQRPSRDQMVALRGLVRAESEHFINMREQTR